MQNEAIETIRICLEQRSIFMTSIYNITKQLQVKASQEEISFDNLLDERQEYMDRIDRCDMLIQARLKELTSDNREHIQSVLAGAKPDNLPKDYTAMAGLADEYNKLLEQTRVLDKQAVQLVTEKHSDLKNRINEIRKNKANTE